MKLPRVLASAVIRTSHEGESHGGLYLVDLDTGDARQVVNWDSRNISFRDRGGERGLRGIVFYEGRIYVTSFDKVLVYDQDFRKLEEYGNPYLADCHETHARGELLYISSTAFDSVLVFDMKRLEFTKGYCLRNDLDRIIKKGIWKAFGIKQCPGARLQIFDPMGADGPRRDDVIHLNNVRVRNDRIYLSAYRMKTVYCVENDKLRPAGKIPVNTHNVRPLGDGFLACSTGDNEAVRLDIQGRTIMSYPAVTYADAQLAMNHLPDDFARAAFVRGLCLHGEELVIVGSSPATVTAYDLSTGEVVKSVNITMDVRNAIHGLEIYPY